MKLNLGCGPKLLDGFVNVDLPGNWSGQPPDVAADISKPLPFGNESADEVHAYHVIEHFQRWQTEDILRDWLRVLKPGGLMVLECPCLDKIIGHYWHYIKAGEPVPDRLTILGLYGDPSYKVPEMMHKWCFSSMELKGLLRGLGMTGAEVLQAQTHYPARDMRVEARKAGELLP